MNILGFIVFGTKQDVFPGVDSVRLAQRPLLYDVPDSRVHDPCSLGYVCKRATNYDIASSPAHLTEDTLQKG
jgi:hypothetical protein